jgi:integrase
VWRRVSGREAADREALFLEGRARDAEERQRTEGAAHGPVQGSAQGRQALKSEIARCNPDGKPLSQSAIEGRAEVRLQEGRDQPTGSHVLRHTFCSHLAMRGAAPKTIQELVGHSTLTMTLTESIGVLDNFGRPVGSAESAAV